MLFRRRSALTATQAAALARVLEAPTFELVPLKNALDQATFLPPGATVSVTASPAKGIEASDIPPDSLTKTSSIAEAYWFANQQTRDGWTHELDLRPSVEKW